VVPVPVVLVLQVVPVVPVPVLGRWVATPLTSYRGGGMPHLAMFLGACMHGQVTSPLPPPLPSDSRWHDSGSTAVMAWRQHRRCCVVVWQPCTVRGAVVAPKATTVLARGRAVPGKALVAQVATSLRVTVPVRLCNQGA